MAMMVRAELEELVPPHIFARDVVDIAAALSKDEGQKFFVEFLEAIKTVNPENADFQRVIKIVKQWQDDLRSRNEELMADGWNGPDLAEALKQSDADPSGGISLDDFLKEEAAEG